MKKNSLKSTIALITTLAFAFASLVGLPTAASASATSAPYNLMLGFDPGSGAVHSGLELGTVITTSAEGYIVSVKYYRFPGDSTTHTAHVWDVNGNLLATKAFTNDSAVGWHTTYLSSPVHVLANETFTISHFSLDNYYIDGLYFPTSTAGPLTVNGGGYLYTDVPGNPYHSSGTNYTVDLDFYTSIATTSDCESMHGTIIDDMCTITYDGNSHTGLTSNKYYDERDGYYLVTVPAGVSSVRLTMQGGSGTGDGLASGGRAAKLVADYPAAEGDVFRLGLLVGATGGMCQDETQLASGDSAMFEKWPADFVVAGGGGSAGCTYDDGETTYTGGNGGDASATLNTSAANGASTTDGGSITAGGGQGSHDLAGNNGGVGANPGSSVEGGTYLGGLGGFDGDNIFGGPGASGVFGAGGGAGGVINAIGGAGGGGGGSYSGSNLHTLISYSLSDTGTTHGYAMLQFPVNSTGIVLSSDKDITSYSFTSPAATGSIDADAHTVDVTVPYGTDVTALVATFALSTSATAAVGATSQTSGTTANDFTSPVTYTVTAEDGTTQDWVVTVAIAMADTTVTISSPTAGTLTAGASVTPSATVSPDTCSTSGDSAITWSLDTNPVTGASETYSLSGASWDTSTWKSGSYTITATYPGSETCNGSSNTVSVTLTNATTSLAITAPTSGTYLSGVVMVGKAGITPSWATGTISWSLDKNPLTGAATTYNLSGNVWNTSKWLPDVYTLTAYYGGSDNTSSSQDSVVITIAPNPTAGSAVGGGWMTYAGTGGTSAGKANFGLEIHKVAATSKTPAYFKGQLVFIQKGKWKVRANLTSFVKQGSPVTGIVTGVASVWRWDVTLNGGLGDWSLVTTQAAIEAKFQASVSGTTKKAGVPGQFGLTLSGFTLPLGAVLPATGLQTLQGGTISIY